VFAFGKNICYYFSVSYKSTTFAEILEMDAENLKNGVNLKGIHKDIDFGETMKVVDSFCFFNIVF